MFAYFLIGVELAILYTTFWYVFLREPKPFTIRGNLWGQYNQSDAFMANHFDPTLPIQQHSPEVMMLNESFYQESRANSAGSDLPQLRRNPALKYGWMVADDKGPRQSSLPRLLTGFRETIQRVLA